MRSKEILDKRFENQARDRQDVRASFSGGEPVHMSPYFLDAVAYARKIGYTQPCMAAATNGIEFAKARSLQKALKRACATPTCNSTA